MPLDRAAYFGGSLDNNPQELQALDALVILATPVICFLLIGNMTRAITSGGMRLVERMTGSVARMLLAMIWTVPMRQLGCLGTLLAWLAVLSAVVTIQVFAGELSLVNLLVWLGPMTIWALIKGLALRRFAPRPLPGRRR